MNPTSKSPTPRLPARRSRFADAQFGGGISTQDGKRWGSFELLELVGKGGFGQVYRAWDPSLEREVALKLLHPRSERNASSKPPIETSEDAAVVLEQGPSQARYADEPDEAKDPTDTSDTQFAELLSEARALASVRHPNILSVYGVDRQDGRVGYWTDFVHGKTLGALVRDQGPFGHREAALVGMDVCQALAAVHRAGLLHRDIKAENVMREEGGRILLMDFGLSTLAQAEMTSAGSPRYMAPELWMGAPATVASDIYAVGVLLFYLVAGEYPERIPQQQAGWKLGADAARDDEETATASFHAGYGETALAAGLASRSVLDHRPDLPQALARVIDKAMRADASHRYQSAGALSSALSEVLAASSSLDRQHGRARVARPWRWAIFAAFVAAILALGGGLAYRNHAAKGKSPAAGEPLSANEQVQKAQTLLLRYDKAKNVADATAILEQVLKQEPNNALAQAGLGLAEFLTYKETRRTGLLEQARTACNRAIQLDPNLAPPYVALARIEAMAGNTALATQQVEKALSIDQASADAFGAQAEIYYSQRRTEDAIGSARKAMELAPDYWRWPVLLGRYYFETGRLTDAADQFKKSLELSPGNAIVLYDLGLALLQSDRMEEARPYLEESARIDPSYEAFSTLGELLASQGRFQDAVVMYKKAVQMDPTDYTAWGNLASGYLWSGGGRDEAMKDYRKAIELALEARKETPKDPILLACLGGYYANIGQAEQGLPLLGQAVAIAPENPEVLFLAGEAYEILHHRSDAIKPIAKAVAMGYHVVQYEHDPELVAIRQDKSFQAALRAERARRSRIGKEPAG